MTSNTETTNFDTNLVDLLRKKFSEEKKAHEETILQLLTAQAQAQTAGAKATKAQELVKETTLKLDQAREEIKSLRAQAQDAQVQAQEAQAKIEDLEAQMAQIRLSEQSQAQAAIDAQEEVRSLRAQTQELETARAKIASLEARMVKAREFFAEVEEETNSEPIDQTQELKAAQVKIENLEVQVAQIKLFEQFQAQAEELKAALAKITELKAQMGQSEKQAQEEILFLNSEIRDQAQELQVAQAKIKDLETQMAQAVIETQSQAQKLQEAQAKICSLEAQVPKPPAPVKMAEQYTSIRESPNQLFCIVQNGLRHYFQHLANCHVFTKFIPKKDATLELAGPEINLTNSFRVIISDGQDYETIAHIGPENKKILIGRLIWKWVTKCTPARINADGNEEYQLQIVIF